MRAVGLPESLRVKVLDTLWELTKTPIPAKGRRGTLAIEQFFQDVETARGHTRDLLSKLAGYKAEADDVAHAKAELVAETKEALGKAQEWLTQRQKDNWQ